MVLLLFLLLLVLLFFAWKIISFLMNIDIVNLYFLPDIIRGAIMLITFFFQIIFLFFTTGGLAFLFGVAIVLGLIMDCLK